VGDKITKCLGLVSQYNPLTVAPGALLKANDCMIRREHILEDRRGHKVYAELSNDITQFLTYQNKVIAHEGTALKYDDGAGTFAAYSGSYSAPTNSRVRFAEAFSNLYATTSLGVKVFSNVTGTAGRLAGAPRALDPSYSLTGVAGFLDNNEQCAYRLLIQRTDANDNVIRGYPSQRLWVVNSAGGARNVILTMYLPSECIAGDVIKVYRTEAQTGVASDTSGDEMGLVYQYAATSTDISNGYVSFTDSVTDDLRGATIYTAPSQEGIAQANERPPLAKDVALYKDNFLIYANVQTKQRLFISLVGTSGLSGRTITLGGVTYNFGASEILSGGGSPQVLVSATGVAAVDIDETARSLVRVINRYASNTTVYAYYLTGPSDLPGQIMIEERGVGAAAFTVQSSDTTIAGMFFPSPPVSPATNSESTSTNSIQKNALYFSKSREPEHVPALNYVFAGSANAEILRIIALRDSVIILKEDGVFRLTGETPQSFSVVKVDDTVFCAAANSVVKLANQVFMLSNQGVVAISESGAEVISREISPNVLPLLTVTDLADMTAALGYESEGCYFLSTITALTDEVATQTLVYNIYTRTWVRHTYAFVAGIVEKRVDKMYFAKPDESTVYIERKSFTDADYADPESSITITAIDGETVDFTIAGTTPSVGWTIAQGTTELAIAEMVSISGGYRATLEASLPDDWAVGAATIYPPVGMDVEWHAITGGAPDQIKQCPVAAVLGDDTLSDNSATQLTFTFRTNFDSEIDEVSIVQDRASWGSAWGTSPWGGGADPVGYPTYVPQNKQMFTRLTFGVKHIYARQKAVIAGCAFEYAGAATRIGR
jgi:hypothetical protein